MGHARLFFNPCCGVSLASRVAAALAALLMMACTSVPAGAASPDDHRDLHRRAEEQAAQKRHGEAVKLAEAALSSAERLYGAYDIRLVPILNRLAESYLAEGRQIEAKNARVRAFTLRRRYARETRHTTRRQASGPRIDGEVQESGTSEAAGAKPGTGPGGGGGTGAYNGSGGGGGSAMRSAAQSYKGGGSYGGSGGGGAAAGYGSVGGSGGLGGSGVYDGLSGSGTAENGRGGAGYFQAKPVIRGVGPNPPPPSYAPDSNPRSAAAGRGVAAAPEVQKLPDFPWPPPASSASYVLPKETFAAFATVGEASTAILKALEKSGYVERSFFGTKPGGVALVTRIEHISNDGTPIDPRWPSGLESNQFDLVNFLRGLFFVSEGHYRVIVFILQDAPFVQSPDKVSEEAAREWLKSGANDLPSDVANRSFKGGKCTALVYEFASDGRIVRVIESGVTGKQHLEKAGLLATLEATTPQR